MFVIFSMFTKEWNEMSREFQVVKYCCEEEEKALWSSNHDNVSPLMRVINYSINKAEMRGLRKKQADTVVNSGLKRRGEDYVKLLLSIDDTNQTGRRNIRLNCPVWTSCSCSGMVLLSHVTSKSPSESLRLVLKQHDCSPHEFSITYIKDVCRDV